MIEELGDLIGAATYFIEKNFTEEEIDIIFKRVVMKKARFNRWNKNGNVE